MQERKDTITFDDLKEKINEMESEEFIIEVPLGGDIDGRE